MSPLYFPTVFFLILHRKTYYKSAHSFEILQKRCLTQIAVNWVEIIRIICTDGAFVDRKVNWGYVSMAAFNEMSQ